MQRQSHYTYPFTLISGTGLGTTGSSLDKIGSLLPLEGFGGAQLLFYPNIYNGNLVFLDNMLPIDELGGKIRLGFTYNSQANEINQLWQFSDKRFTHLSQGDKTAVLREADGHLTTYTLNNKTGLYTAPASVNGIAWLRFHEKDKQWYRYQPWDNTTEIYRSDGLLVSHEDQQGRKIQYEYDNNSQLKVITGQSGSRYEIRRTKDTIAVYLTGGSDDELLKLYQFDDQGRLLFSQSPKGCKTEYQYGSSQGAWQLIQVKQSDQTLLKFSYDEKKRLSTFNLGQESVFKLQCVDDTHPEASLTDAYNGITNVGVDANADIVKVSRSQGFDSVGKKKDTTVYTYNAMQQLTSMTHPNAAEEKFTWLDFFGLLQTHTKSDGQVSEMVYHVDADDIRLIGEIQYENATTPLVTRYTYDNHYNQNHAFLRFKITPKGNVTEYRPDQSGNIASERKYLDSFINLEHRDPRTSPSLDEMQQWVAKQHPQNVTLTEYAYTPRGQLVLTHFFADVDEQGNGIKDDQMGEIFTFPNMYGNWFTKQVKQTSEKKNNVAITQRSFDDLQRLTSETDALQQTTTWQYLDVNGQVKIKRPNGRVKTQQKNDRGLVSQVQEVVNDDTRLTKYARDTNGRTGLITRPDGCFVYPFYDHQDRLGYEVSTTGIVTEYVYDVEHRYQSETTYAASIDPTQLFFKFPPQPGFLPIAGKLIKLLNGIRNQAKDRTSYVFYDLSDRPIYHVDAEKYVTQFSYDKLDRKTLEVKWHKALTDDQLSQLKSGGNITLDMDVSKDRCTRYFYDHDSMLIGEQDAGGYVTEYTRDFAEQIAEKIQYSNKVPINLAKQNFNEIRPITSAQDAHYKFFYNARLEMWYEYSPGSHQNEYYATEHIYYPNGLKQKSIQYHDKVTKISPAPSQGESEKDRVTYYHYDLLDRPVDTILPNQKSETKKYDVSGNLVLQQSRDLQHPERMEADYQRSLGYQYDGWDQKIKDINVFGGEITHRYDPLTGLKTHTTDALNQVTYYFYDRDKRLVAIIDPTGAVIENILDNAGGVIQTTRYANQVAQGKITEGGYLTPEIKKLFVADPQHDEVTLLEHNQRGLVYQATDARKNRSTYEYNAFSQVTVEHLPVKNNNPVLEKQHDFDARGLEIMTTISAPDVSAETIVRLYDSFRAKETYRLDARNGIYRMAYDLRGLTEKIERDDGVSPATHQFTYTAFDELETETDALGNTTTHTYNILERTQITHFPVTNVMEIVTQNIFNEMIKREDALHNVESWQHAANGKTRVYTDSLQKNQTNEFNIAGQLIKITDANLVVTELEYDPVSNIRSQTEDATGLKYKTTYTRDSFGNPFTIIDPRRVVTKNSFDQSNNQIQSVRDAVEQGLNLILGNEYNAQNKITSETQGDKTNLDQYQETYQIDNRNRLIGSIIDPQGLAIAVARHLDAASDVIAEVDGNGNISRKFYDTLGRLRFTVDPEGGVKEKNYNKEDKILYTRVYELAIDPSQLNDQTNLKQLMQMVKTDDADTLIYYFYDADGMERFQANSLGAVGERQYNLAKHEIKSIQYAKQVDPKKLPVITTEQLAALVQPGPNDRINRFILDEKYQKRFVMDGENYISEKRYDANGNVIASISYAVKVADPAKIASLPASQVHANLVLDPANDRKTYTVFDSRNHPEYAVDGEGCVTQYWHDENSNLTQSCEYKTKITVPGNYADLVTLLKRLVPDAVVDRIIKSSFDNANRKISETDPLNHVDQFKRDALDNIIAHTDRANHDWLYQYDTAKQLKSETTPSVTVTRVQQAILDHGVKLTYDTVDLAIENKKIRDKNGNEKQIIKAFNSPSPRTLDCVYNKRNQLVTTKVSNVFIDDDSKPGNFENPPVKTVDVITNTVYNAKKLKVCEQNESGQWFFYVYNSEGNLTYTINSLKFAKHYLRNAFGEIVTEVSYAKAINLDVSQYTRTGIPFSIIQQPGVIIKSTEDRFRTDAHDHLGNIILTQQGPIFSYVSYGTDHPDYGTDYSQIKKYYNAFRQCVYQSVLLDKEKEVWSQQLYWFDRKGNKAAECDPVYRVVRYSYDSIGNEIEHTEWAKSPKIIPTPATSLKELDDSHDVSVDDRMVVFDHDVAGQCIKKITKQVIIQEVTLGANDVPSMKNLPPQDLYQLYQYSAIQQQIAVTYEDGSTAYTWHDALGQEIAVTDVMRKQIDTNVDIIPLTYLGYDFFGHPVRTTRFKTGTASATPNAIPIPIATDPADQTELKYGDHRGLTQFRQNAEGHVVGLTYTATRKLAREYYTLTNQDAKHIDEKRFDFDTMDQPVLMRVMRDNQPARKTASLYNAFGNCIAEGPGDNTFPLYRHFDVLGRCWSTNENGVNKITLGNLSGHMTAEFQSPTKDLSQVTYDQLRTMLSWEAKDLEREEMVRDAIGRKIIKTKPAYSVPDNNEPTNIPLSLVAGSSYADFGSTSITWVKPQETTVVPKFMLWPVGKLEQKQELTIKTVDNRCGVDVSALASDMYAYQINYYFINPVTHEPDNDPSYRTEGKVQVITTHANGFYPVFVVETDNQLSFTGNTNNLTAIQLRQNNQNIVNVPVQSQNSKLIADLSSYESGVYTLIPIITDRIDLPESLSFNIYTNKPAKTPLSKEILSTFDLKFLEKNGHHAQLIWNVPKDYQHLSVRMKCKYHDVTNVERIHEDVIPVGRDLGHYTDSEGHVLICNTEFEHRIKQVMELSLFLEISVTESIGIASQVYPGYVTGDGITTIMDTTFAGSSVAYIVPLTGFSHLPTLLYLDMSKDRLADWKELPAISMTKSGVVVDVTGLSPCIYPFKLSSQASFLKTSDRMQQPWQAILPHKNVPVTFYEAIPLREVGMNFNLLKTDRKTVVNSLMSYKNNATIRKQLASDIVMALTHEILPADEKWQMLKDSHDNAIKLFQQHNSTFARRRIMHGFSHDEEAIHQEATKVQRLQTRLIDYCTKERVYENYINALGETVELSPQAALLYAKTAGISLFLWEKDMDKPMHYKLIDSHDAGESASFVLHLDVSLHTQFSVLLPEGITLESLYGEEPEYSFTVTHGKGIICKSNPLPILPPVEEQRSYRFDYDHWHNLVKLENTRRLQTEYQYNLHNERVTQVDPLVQVVEPDGTFSDKRPVTIWGYDKRGFRVGETNPNLHTDAFILDSAGQEITYIAGDGTKVRKQGFNALGQRESHTDARNSTWHYQFNHLNAMIKITYPSGKFTQYTYNELNLRTIDADEAQQKTIYDYDALLNISRRLEPSGHAVAMSYDRNGEMTEIHQPDNTQMSWARNYFGRMDGHVDLANIHYTYLYDLKGQKIRQFSAAGSRMNKKAISTVRPTVLNNRTYYYSKIDVSNAPVQDLTYQYESGLLTQVNDNAMGEVGLYRYNTEDQQTFWSIKRNEVLLRQIQTDIDNLGRDKQTNDSGEIVNTWYDVAGNRRIVNASGLQSQKLSYEYDSADRVIHEKDVDGKGKIIRDLTLAFQSGFRTSETNTQGLFRSMRYDVDGILTDETYHQLGGMKTHRDYTANGILTKYTEADDKDHVHFTHEIKSYPYGWQYDDSQKKNTVVQAHTIYGGFTNIGLPTTQNTDYTNNIRDEMTNHYTAYDDQKLTGVSGRRRNRFGWGPLTVATRNYDPNAMVTYEEGLQDDAHPNNTNPVKKVYTTSYDGRILTRENFQQLDVKWQSGHWKYEVKFLGRVSESKYFYNTRNELIASYGVDITDPYYQVTVNYLQHCTNRFRSWFRSGIGMAAGNTLMRSMMKQHLTLARFQAQARAPHLFLPDFVMTYPAPVPDNYTVASGDNFVTIAQRLYGDAGFSSTLAAMNGFSLNDKLFIGQVLNLPQYLPNMNNANIHTPYDRFISIMIVNLYPYLEMMQPPQPKKKKSGGFLSKLVHAIVDTVAVVVGAIVATFIPVAAPIVIAVVTAIMDAAYQEVAVQIGWQDHFSLSAALTAGIEAGVTAGILGVQAGSFSETLNTAKNIALREMILKTGEIAVANQLTEMAMGMRDKFDFGAVVTEVLSAVVMYKAAPLEDKLLASNEFVRDVAHNEVRSLVGNGLQSAITGQRLDLESLTASALGSSIGKKIGDNIVESIQSSKPQKKAEVVYEKAKKESVNSIYDPEADRKAFEKLNDPTISFGKGSRQLDALSQLDNPVLDYSDAGQKLSEMNRERLQRWQAESKTTRTKDTFFNNKSVAPQNTFRDEAYGLLDLVANSKIVSGINSTGEWLNNTPVFQAINMVNPIVVGGQLLDESIALFRQGNTLSATAGMALAMLSVVPGEALASESIITSTRYLGNKLSMFGKGAESEIVLSRTEYLQNKYGYLTREQRQVRIDELAIGNRVLRENNVPSQFISEALQSFEPGTIKVAIADNSTYGLRFYGGVSKPQGAYMNPTFPLGNVRELNALPIENQISNIVQWQVKPGVTYLFGRIRPNFGQPGGGVQMYIPNPKNNILTPKW